MFVIEGGGGGKEGRVRLDAEGDEDYGVGCNGRIQKILCWSSIISRSDSPQLFGLVPRHNCAHLGRWELQTLYYRSAPLCFDQSYPLIISKDTDSSTSSIYQKSNKPVTSSAARRMNTQHPQDLSSITGLTRSALTRV